jgi:23S rRNA pseudouridine1911/1915/1917 synthase
MDIPVIYEDNHLLVVEKPCNIGVQGDSSGDRDMLTLLKGDLKTRYQKPGNVFLALVHRLDRPVGGVLALAKTSKAASRLTAQVRQGNLERCYLAVTHGRPVPRSAILENYLIKDEQVNRVKVLDHDAPGSKFARLEYRELAFNDIGGLVWVRLHTGRSHQIRSQLAYAGYPIWGDQKYGKAPSPGRQVALWSYKLSFMHPTKNERMSFISLPPQKAPWDTFPEHAYDLMRNPDV